MATAQLYCVCRQPYDVSRFMIECDICKDWFHGSCVEVEEHHAVDIDVYHCPNCDVHHGPSLMKKRRNWHRHDYTEPDDGSKPVQAGTSVFVRELQAKTFPSGDEIFQQMHGSQVTQRYLERHGFRYPIAVHKMEGLGLRLPPPDFSVKDVERYVEEELAIMDREREERYETEQTRADERTRANSNWWCKCGCCQQMPTEIESLCCQEWDQVLPSMVGVNVDPEDPGQIACVAATDEFAAMIHPAVLDFFFRREKINWKKQPRPSGPDGQLSPDQNRLVSYRIVLEWALQGETLGRGHRKPLPSCVVGAVRQRYPSEFGVYVGFQEINDALDIL